MAAQIYLAREVESGRIYHIDEVHKEDEKKFKCIGCGENLIPVKTVQKLRDWHYRHAVELNCVGAKDKALHDFAVQILFDSTGLAITKDLNIEYTEPRKELAFLNYRSDVAVKFDDADVHFEIYVTHDVTRDKIQCYRQNKIRSVKIDLSARHLRKESSEKIKYEVLKNFENRTLFFWKDQEITDSQSNDSDDFIKILLGALVAVVAFFGIKALCKWLKNK